MTRWRCAPTYGKARDDLARAPDVEFAVEFPNENTAKQFADHIRERDNKILGTRISTLLVP
jgi:hypothetical protein